MKSILLATAYIRDLLEGNNNILLIEVWDRVLYARKKKGCGERNEFISKKGLEYQLPVYYEESKYKSVSKEYHPDRVKQTVSKQRIATKLFQNISLSRPALSKLFKGRRCDGISFVRRNELFAKFSRSSWNKKAAILLGRIESEIYKAGFSDTELFGNYRNDPLDQQMGEHLQFIDDSKEILQGVTTAISNGIEKLKEEDPWFYQQQEDAFTCFS